MVRQNSLSQRKFSMYGAYWEHFWIRPVHFFVRSTNRSRNAPPTLRKRKWRECNNFFFWLIRYEFAILQNKLKGTPVIPLFVARAEQDQDGNVTFHKFKCGEHLGTKLRKPSARKFLFTQKDNFFKVNIICKNCVRGPISRNYFFFTNFFELLKF